MNSFATVTELPGNGAHRAQLAVLRTRYEFAARQAIGCDVLEIGCGAGLGLGYVARQAKSVTGGDIDPAVLRFAREHYAGRPSIRVMELDAMNMALPDASFDVVLCFEALYYFESINRFLEEAKRVLRPGGLLIGSSVNCQWHGFNPSPYSRQYYALDDLRQELAVAGFQAKFFMGFEDRPNTVKRRIVSAIRTTAVKLQLIPTTMRGKELLKRLFYGELSPLPNELTPDIGEVVEPREVTSEIDPRLYEFIYFIATRP